MADSLTDIAATTVDVVDDYRTRNELSDDAPVEVQMPSYMGTFERKRLAELVAEMDPHVRWVP